LYKHPFQSLQWKGLYWLFSKNKVKLGAMKLFYVLIKRSLPTRCGLLNLQLQQPIRREARCLKKETKKGKKVEWISFLGERIVNCHFSTCSATARLIECFAVNAVLYLHAKHSKLCPKLVSAACTVYTEFYEHFLYSIWYGYTLKVYKNMPWSIYWKDLDFFFRIHTVEICT